MTDQQDQSGLSHGFERLWIKIGLGLGVSVELKERTRERNVSEDFGRVFRL